MKQLALSDKLAFGFTALFAVGTIGAARALPVIENAHSGPGSFPQALGWVLLFLALAGVYQGMKSSPPAAAEDEDSEARIRLPWLGGLTVAYLLVMPYLGFISSTALLFAAALAVLGYRRFAPALATGFLFAFLLYWGFGIMMNVSLPQGWVG
jgi:putative tricarboxylic transport membrane protein